MGAIQIIEHNNQRVLLTSQLAESFGTTSQIISNNFNRNKGRYVEDKHYFGLSGQEKRDFINRHQNDLGSRNATVLYLWTEKGAWMHAKSLNTDQAWDAYEMLVDDYYSIKGREPMSVEDLIILQAQSMKEIKEKVSSIEQTALNAHERIDNLDQIDITGNKRDRLVQMVRKYALSIGVHYGVAWSHFKQRYNTAYNTNLVRLIGEYQKKTGQDLTIPAYLEKVDRLDDAIRVADKMLNS
ncbi:ORF6N domain-containing protein [Paenibacillus alvei]|uniref:ORF6N domain-containing protein n=1 Tax=Paenibacillus alvei TaxID=44250 RepID=UPI0018CF9F46|nr:ORF6N domain-containing protein [Paenibacillus alvei]MCY9577978.1 ORF6N domain-containing protein [Paenibacillus alvei]MCY9583155.1 ORF6N domain-containing protein [Paenibacillus alvei]